MKRIFNKTFFYSLSFSILLLVATSLLLLSYEFDISGSTKKIYCISEYNNYKYVKLKRKKKFIYDYSRVNIVNSKNINKKSDEFPQKIYFESEKRINSAGLFERIYNLFWATNYVPGDISNAHYGLRNRCTLCHSFFNLSYKEKCLSCHKALAEKIKLEKGFHYNKRNETCIQCHLEHLGDIIKLVDLSSFRHVYSEYQLIGYHQITDCYDCHQKATPVKPNSIVSENAIARPWLRFSISKFKECIPCHPDPHNPTFGEDCEFCHPLHLRWYQ
jgi:hypothetical protein